jgi:membrane protein DedA with SNARE-associated domain
MVRTGVAKAWLTLGIALRIHHVHVHVHVHGSSIGYLGVALASAASWLGVPGPGEPLLIAAGVLAAKNKLDITTVIVIAFASAVAGGIAGWMIGLKAGRAVLTTRGPLHDMRRGALARGDHVFDRYPIIAILLTPSWIAGIHKVRPLVYHIVNVISAAVWAVGIGLAAYYIGPSVIDFVSDLGWVTGAGLVLLLALIVGAEILRRRRRRRAAETDLGDDR